MMNWWSGLSGREKSMILIAGLLSVALAFYVFAFMPLREAQGAAQREYSRMSRDAGDVFEGLSELQSVVPEDRPAIAGQGQSLELLLSQTASARGLEIVRLQPSGNGELTVWFEAAEPTTLMSWITELDRLFGVSVHSADLGKVSNTNVLRGNVRLAREVAG